MFRFDKDDKLIVYTSTESDIDMATGIAVDVEPVKNRPVNRSPASSA